MHKSTAVSNQGRQVITLMVLVATLFVGVPTSAFASTSPFSTTGWSATHSTTRRLAWKSWHNSWIDYLRGLNAIDASYRASVKTARLAYGAAIATSSNRADRLAAKAQLVRALDAALLKRVAAITAVNFPPAPPAGFGATRYVNEIRRVNIDFRSALVVAETAFAQAVHKATSDAQRSRARAALRMAINKATLTRAQDLAALGPPPANPTMSIG
ncbi:MAG: hypothetical protein HKL86_01245 [Acidimicrobiaceae bacterium]|nr:hypothetical protein [Acidimicrobiaceae bacterium]